MPPSDIFRLFRDSHCRLLRVAAAIPITRSTIAKLRGTSRRAAKSTREPLWFATAYPGEHKFKIGLAANIKVAGKRKGEILLRWFVTDIEPPDEFGDFEEFVAILGK